MTSITKRDLVKHFRQSLVEAGLKTDFEDSLICPLCWEERRFNELTLEHVVPRAVGGTHKTVTCRSCNNTHGSELDSHLVNFQVTRDALLGIELRAVKMPHNRTYLLVPCKVGEYDCVLVIIRVRKVETTYLAVYMPNSDQPIEEYFALMEQCKRDNNGKSITIPRDGFFV